MRTLPIALTLSASAFAGVVFVARVPAQERPTLFTDEQRAALLTYWNAPGRYASDLPDDAASTGPWVVRLTSDGSEWLLRYQRKLTAGKKVPPGQVVTAPEDGATATWEPWLAARLAADRAEASRTAATANAQLAVKPAPSPSPDGKTPGPIPTSLLATLGNPPPFARAVLPMRYKVSLDSPDETYSYVDHVKLPERFAYYRFPLGVVSYGKQLADLPDAERSSLFSRAGFSDGERKIFCAVSGLEGGFETVQTYDTGFVSVGFIQFVTLAEGKHDLSKVLQDEKKTDPKAYESDFRRFGIDVGTDDALTVIDPVTGAELFGAEAVRKVIDDKRLLAVFQRAGRHSDAYKVSQIKVARSFYWPTADKLTVSLADGAKVEGTIGDVVKSEAGLATLLDRKINTGNTRPLEDVVSGVMQAHGLKTVAEAAPYEREIISQMKYRRDFLASRDLAQPPSPPDPKNPKVGKKPNFWQKLWKSVFG